ncbi:hypothetical protein ABIB82_000586 [Bradyrhizobium sp. i1.8.4]
MASHVCQSSGAMNPQHVRANRRVATIELHA